MSGKGEAFVKGTKGTRFVDDFKKVIDSPSTASTDDIISVLKDPKLSPEIKNRLE